VEPKPESSALVLHREGRARFLHKDKAARDADDLRPEYHRSDLKGGVRGKYLARYEEGANLVLLAPDVRAAFPTDESVNAALRSLTPESLTSQ
jgi:hypothetical protein